MRLFRQAVDRFTPAQSVPHLFTPAAARAIRPAMREAGTVGDLIDEGVRVTHSCQWCGLHEDTDLRRIAFAKGRDFSLTDRLPLCTNGDCQGMLRFKAWRGGRSEWLMTSAGEARFQRHSDWMFETRQIERRRAAQLKARQGL